MIWYKKKTFLCKALWTKQLLSWLSSQLPPFPGNNSPPPRPPQSKGLQESFWQHDCLTWPCPKPPVNRIKSVHLTQIGPKSPFLRESGFRSKRFLLNLSALSNRGHVNTGTAGRGYFQPFGQGNWESQPAGRDKNGECVPEKRDERQRKRASCFPYHTPGPAATLSHLMPAPNIHGTLPVFLSTTSVFVRASSNGILQPETKQALMNTPGLSILFSLK